MIRPLFTLAITGLLASTTYAALSLQGYNADNHHRYANPVDPDDFIGSSNNWTGVGLESGGATRWATMISSSYFISAEHAAPTVGNDIIFHTDNNPGGTTVAREVLSVTQVGSTDLVIGKLSSAPGATIAIYSVAADATTTGDFASSVYSDREAFVVGRDVGISTTSFRVGRNELDGFGTFEDPPTIGDAITFDDDRLTPESLGADEAFLISGDSGAPLFITTGDDLVLTGINWFTNPASGGDLRYSGSTFVPNYISEINLILAADGESLTLVSVPEPSSVLCLTLGALTLLRRRR